MKRNSYEKVESYIQLLINIDNHLHDSRHKAINEMNRSLLICYWGIGKMILSYEFDNKTIEDVILSISRDLRHFYPESIGYSVANLKLIALFVQTYPDFLTHPSIVGIIPWSFHIELLSHTTSPEERMWYMNKIVDEGWSIEKLKQNLRKKTFMH